jgi:hypothetical protein
LDNNFTSFYYPLIASAYQAITHQVKTEAQGAKPVTTGYVEKGFWFKIAAEVDFKPETYSSISRI